jgi:hypothetical protein
MVILVLYSVWQLFRISVMFRGYQTTGFFRHQAKVTFWIAVLFLALVFASGINGYSFAMKQDGFWQSADMPDYLIVRKSGDRLVAKRYDAKTNALGNEIMILKVDQDEPVTLRWVKTPGISIVGREGATLSKHAEQPSTQATTPPASAPSPSADRAHAPSAPGPQTPSDPTARK